MSVHSLHRISKYTGKEGMAPKVHKPGLSTWATTKSKTKKRVKEIAYDSKAQAVRQAARPTRLRLHAGHLPADRARGELGVPGHPDQLTATEAVKEDMEKEVPMDRLVCGDVGFGKTEIAIRAAFKAATDACVSGRARAHDHFVDAAFPKLLTEVKEFPVKVDYVNRFKTGKKMTETVNALEAGEIDILIGTHAMVGKRVKWKDLGLLIIDEEQKFGVAVKDKLKTLRATVDTLTLTATPIRGRCNSP